MLTAREIRQRYLDFFSRKAHKIAESGPLVPPGDDSLLFTNAGMVQFKDFFLGEEKKDFTRAATCQKCLRVSGKHNDLENVGRTARHHTFFEMLGNFSFGDYFKKEAIAWAWEFVTSELGLPADKLWVTVYKDDDEAAEIWKTMPGFNPAHIVRMGEKDNFWTMGDTGPCGPCSEIYIDQGESMSCGDSCGIGHCECDRFLEIWNLVFTQYDQGANGERKPLAAPNIDTGMGLERIAAVCQGKKSNFDCDLFREIIDHAAELAGVKYSESAPDTNDIDTALRVIADHARAAAFMIAEGILPSNEKRGYVLRRLIRRALRFATLMGVEDPFLYKVARKVVDVMGETYPEIAKRADFIERAVFEEEKRFSLTLRKGLDLLENELRALEEKGEKIIPGEFCFRLYDTYGFPIDIIADVAEKRGFAPDYAGFERLMKEQRARGRENRKKAGLLGNGKDAKLVEVCRKLQSEGAATMFVGYETLEAKTPLLALLNSDGERVKYLEEGETGWVVAAETPFYGESGGQIGDIGVIISASGAAKALTTSRPIPNMIIQQVKMEAGEFHEGQEAELRVDADTRANVTRNHTCAHLLHAALRRVLGEHVRQAGSLVDGSKIRFDFSHFAALSAEELAAVERDVNRMIMADLPAEAKIMPKDEALAAGAMALFSEKYGDDVRVLRIGADSPESMELCGGTHLTRTGQAGMFLILNESSVAAGVRRIEAVSGWNAYNVVLNQRGELNAVAMNLQAPIESAAEKAWALQEEIRKLRKNARATPSAEIDEARINESLTEVGDIKVVSMELKGAGMKVLRELMDKLRGKFEKKAVVCLAGVENGKAAMALYVSKDLHEKFAAPAAIKEVASIIGGSGGG
ncbi:MAG: alanine--tRNA ligase, partial [Desulfovibrio sp.]|nr:alanine--tRNA ligase [Desulfovibrio sp.]